MKRFIRHATLQCVLFENTSFGTFPLTLHVEMMMVMVAHGVKLVQLMLWVSEIIRRPQLAHCCW